MYVNENIKQKEIREKKNWFVNEGTTISLLSFNGKVKEKKFSSNKNPLIIDEANIITA